MSGESALHVRLVECLVTHVRRQHLPPRGLLVLADHHSFGQNHPPTIDGFKPDLFASDLPTTFEIIGEAKTIGDLQTDRSRRQIVAFLDYLALRDNSTFYLAVPPFNDKRARSILKRYLTQRHECVRVEIVDGV